MSEGSVINALVGVGIFAVVVIVLNASLRLLQRHIDRARGIDFGDGKLKARIPRASADASEEGAESLQENAPASPPQGGDALSEGGFSDDRRRKAISLSSCGQRSDAEEKGSTMGIVRDEAILECLGDKIVQIGIVVPDLDKTMQGMRDVFGLEPDSAGDVVYEKVKYRGVVKDAPVRNAFYNHFNVQLEFLEPLGDEGTVWSDYLKMGQRGLHHVRFDVEDNQRCNELMAEKGIEVWMEGESLVTPGVTFTYYDSVDKLGYIVEAVTKAAK